MEFSKSERVKFLSCIVILLSVSFLLGEVFGLYSISQLNKDLDTIFSTLYMERCFIRKLGKILWFYLPCVLPLLHFRLFIVVPAVLFFRGYLFSCSLAAISYMHLDDIGNLFGIIISTGTHTMSLTVLASNLLYYVLVKRKFFYGNLTAERQSFVNTVIFTFLSILICSICELIIDY